MRAGDNRGELSRNTEGLTGLRSARSSFEDAARLSAEGFLEVAWGRGISVRVPFADKPYVLAFPAADAGGSPHPVLYADFSAYRLLRASARGVETEQFDEDSFIPALLALLNHRGAR